MNRMALSLAALFVTASALFYLFGIRAVLMLGALFCLLAVVGFFYCKSKGLSFKAVAVLLAGAVLCLYLTAYSSVKIEPIEALAGQSKTVVCRVIEEPTERTGYTEFLVETDGTNGFDGGLMGSVRLIIYIGDDSEVSNASEGDIISADINFKPIDESARKARWSERVFTASSCTSAEVIGRKETLYTRLIDLRRSIRNNIDIYVDGDNAAVLKGLLLGDISGMSDELRSDFKVCGVAHVTAVSGMHIGALCMMVTSILSLFMSRRKASAFAFIPLVVTVMLAGATPSAVRAGIMCSLTLLGDCLLKKTDSLNSLGIAVSAMLIYNPFYILSLGFQLSCSASAGVIISAPYGMSLAEKLAITRFRTVNIIINSAVRIFCASIGAVVLTLPFQIIAFGFVSVIAPLASTLICSAAVYAMAVTVVALILNYIPYVEYIAVIPFWVSELLATYICTVVHLLAKIPFSYIPLGNNTAVLCLGMSLALVSLWLLLDRPGGKRAVSLLVTVLLVSGLLSDYVASRDMVEVAVLNTGDALCTVVSYDGRCIVIGCGDNSSDRYTLKTHLTHRGVTEVEALFIPSESEACFGGYEFVTQEIEPEVTVVPDNFGNSTVFSGGVTVAADGSEFLANDGKIKIKTVKCKYGCIYEISLYEKKILVGNAVYNTDELGIKDVDCVITSRLIPQADADIMIISASSEINYNQPLRVLTTEDRTVSIKLKPDKGMTVYAGQN